MDFGFGEKRHLGVAPGSVNAYSGYQDVREADSAPKLKRRRRFFHASSEPASSAVGKEEFTDHESENIEEEVVHETEPVAPLNALELRDVVISDLVQKGWALSAHCRQKRAGKASQKGFAGEVRAENSRRSSSRLRAAQEASFVTIPTGQASGSAELLEQMSQFESSTRQRLLIFGLERLSEEVFTPNRHLWQDHSHELGVLLHLHPDRRTSRRRRLQPVPQNKSQAAESSQGKQQEDEPKAPQP